MLLLKLIPILLVLCKCVQSQPHRYEDYVKTAFHQIKLVPDILDHAPKDLIHVMFPKENVDLGEIISPLETSYQPAVYWPVEGDEHHKVYYTLLMIDPDSPSRKLPLLREVNHWLVMNICGNDLKTGETIVEYMGASPAFGTGHHRFTFLAFKQPGLIDLKKMKRIPKDDRLKRIKFDTRKFIKVNHLTGPVAGNFFEAAFDKEGKPLLDKLLDLVD